MDALLVLARKQGLCKFINRLDDVELAHYVSGECKEPDEITKARTMVINHAVHCAAPQCKRLSALWRDQVISETIAEQGHANAPAWKKEYFKNELLLGRAV